MSLATALLMSASAAAQAEPWGHGFTDPRLWVNGRQHLSGNMAGACQFGHDVWNRTGTRASVGWNDATPALLLRVGSLAPRTYGVFVTTWQERNGRAITANITLDTANISSGPLPGLWSHKIQGVYAHELGHGLNLKDNPNTGRVSLMKYGSQGLQGGYYWPQPYDIEDVRRIFP